MKLYYDPITVNCRKVAAGFGLIVAALTMAAIPALSGLGTWLVGRRARDPRAVDPALLPPDEPDEAGRVLVAGFGRVGRTVAAMLEAHRVAYVALDSDVDRVAAARRAGA